MLLRIIEQWFSPVEASQDYRRTDFVLLFLILVAGTWLRFWNLGAVGLHGDEDIMGLAARGVVEHGIPILPSGMVYVRAALHTYILAASTMLFGDTEWALRMPSAVVGSLCGLIAFYMGRRFLDPKPNLAFVALVAFLPAMIDISKTARMYVFFVAALMVFATLLFRWERNGRYGALLLAFLAWVLATHLHFLAIFAAPLFLFPGLANRSWKQLLQGAGALAMALLVLRALQFLQGLAYPDREDRLELPEQAKETALQLLTQASTATVIGIAAGLALLASALGTVGLEGRRQKAPGTLLLAAGSAACGLLHYHLGVTLLLFGALVWLRVNCSMRRRALLLFTIIGLTAALQYHYLDGTEAFPGRKIIGAFIGTPSVWPALRFAEFSPVGAVLTALAVCRAVYELALGRRVPIYFLFFAMAVWAPLLALGAFKWYLPDRYTISALPFFLMFLPAASIYCVQGVGRSRLGDGTVAAAKWSAAVALLLALINPAAAWRAANSSYLDHPDHKGAANFLRLQRVTSADLVVAEDSIVQTYYLGEIDYRLQHVSTARNHSIVKDGKLLDQYTGVPVIGSGQELASVILSRTAGRVYVVGEAQVGPDLRRRNRAGGIMELLDSGRFQVAYVGRDAETRVWKLIE